MRAGWVRGSAHPRPERLTSPAKVKTLPVLDEVDDRAVVGIVPDREINPVPAAGIPADDDLVATRAAHSDAVPAALAAVEDIALRRRVFGQVDLLLEVVDFLLTGWEHGLTIAGR